jgi:hypothetical protein
VLLRKFHSYAQYHCDDLYVSEAMKVYKSAKKDEKHEILRRFADDKTCKWVVTMNERNIQQQITGSDFTEGEMTEWEIADLNKLPRDHPNYRVLLDGLLAGLPCREHPIEAWRPHTKLYTYSHEGHLVHHRRETEERTLEASKDLGKSKQITVVVKKEHVVLKSLQQDIKNVKTWENKLTTALRDGKKICAKLKANRKNTEDLNHAIATLNTFLDQVVEQVASFETVDQESEEAEQQNTLQLAKEVKEQCMKHHTVFNTVLKKQHSDERK